MTSEYVPFEEGHLVSVTLSYFLDKAKGTIEEHLESTPEFFTVDCKEEHKVGCIHFCLLMGSDLFAKEIMRVLPPMSEIAKEMGVKENSEIFSKLPEICEEASKMIAREIEKEFVESVSKGGE